MNEELSSKPTVQTLQGIHILAKPIGPGDGAQPLAAKSLQTGFGTAKETALPRSCMACDVLKACQGGAPNTTSPLHCGANRVCNTSAPDTGSSFAISESICM